MKKLARGLEDGQGLVGGASPSTIRLLLAEMSASDDGENEPAPPTASKIPGESEMPGVAPGVASELVSDGGTAASYLAGKYAAASEAAARGERVVEGRREKETETKEKDRESKLDAVPGRKCGACGAAGATQRCGRCNLVW